MVLRVHHRPVAAGRGGVGGEVVVGPAQGGDAAHGVLSRRCFVGGQEQPLRVREESDGRRTMVHIGAPSAGGGGSRRRRQRDGSRSGAGEKSLQSLGNM